MKKKPNIVIRMGAGKFTADVRSGDKLTHFDMNKMEKREVHIFRRALVAAFAEAQGQ